MSKIFIGGSRRISRLNAAVRQRIDRIVDQNLSILIGDANGADKAVQRYLESRNYDNVEVFCVEGTCRNNLGSWRLRSVKSASDVKDFDYYAAKDRLMASEARFGLMIWDGKSLGTLVNVFRLASQHKKVVIYTVPTKQFREVGSLADWESFLSRCSDDVRRRVIRQMKQEGGTLSMVLQSSLF